MNTLCRKQDYWKTWMKNFIFCNFAGLLLWIHYIHCIWENFFSGSSGWLLLWLRTLNKHAHFIFIICKKYLHKYLYEKFHTEYAGISSGCWNGVKNAPFSCSKHKNQFIKKWLLPWNLVYCSVPVLKQTAEKLQQEANLIMLVKLCWHSKEWNHMDAIHFFISNKVISNQHWTAKS